MKLDIRDFRYLSFEDWRVLTAVEMGSKKHEVVPTPLINQLSSLRTGSSTVSKSISALAKAGLIAKVKNIKYDGYRLTYGGLDYLALHSHVQTSAITHIGSPMGVGKESDILLVTSAMSNADHPIRPAESILKIHRLGRTSFRSAKNNRAYHGNRTHCSWQQLSRLSAQREYAAMSSLSNAGFRVPRPIAQNRHTIVMSLVPGLPLLKVPMTAFGASRNSQAQRVARLYADCMELTLSLAEVGIIHGDLNEFNILVENVAELEETKDQGTNDGTYEGRERKEDTLGKGSSPTGASDDKPLTPHLIDFPQITSLSHPQAEEYFARDIQGIKAWFRKRYNFESNDPGPTFADAVQRLQTSGKLRLDIEIEAAGASKRLAKELSSEAQADARSHSKDDDSEADDSDVSFDSTGRKDPQLHVESVLGNSSPTEELKPLHVNDDQDAAEGKLRMTRLVLPENDNLEHVGTVAQKKASGWSI